MTAKCPAHASPELGYLAAHADAEERMKRKEIQRRCRLCGLWIWTEHFTDDTAMGESDHMHNRALKAQERQAKKERARDNP